MPQKTDMYSVLYSYARKNQSAQINIETFIFFLEKYSQRVCEEKPEWKRWTEDTGPKVWMELSRLAEEEKITLINNEKGNQLYFSHYFIEIIKEIYRSPDDDSDIPFPDERTLNVEIPQDLLKPLRLPEDFINYLKEPQEEILPIIKLVFPDNNGSALVLSPMISLTLLNYSALKIRNFLLKPGNKEYIQRKITTLLPGKDDYLRETFAKIMTRPEDCVNDLIGGWEFSYYFWAHFCNLVRLDLGKKGELLIEETGALQAVYIMEACNSFYKAKFTKNKEIELAFKCFEREMELPPYYYTKETIAAFKDSKGTPLLGQYSQHELDAYIKKRISEPATPTELPDLLYFNINANTTWLIKKSKLLPLCARLLGEARPIIIKAVSKRWRKLIKEFRRESAMDNDRDFERLIADYVLEHAPALCILFDDRRVYLVHEEIERDNKKIPESIRFFNKDELMPFHVLLILKRKEIVSDVKLLLPFWYTLPVISTIIALFSSLGKKKNKKYKEDESVKTKSSENQLKQLSENAVQLKEKIIPKDYTLDTYLIELSSRWGFLVDKKAKENLVNDVNSVVREKLRHLLRTQRIAELSNKTLDNLANSIMDSSHGLHKIKEHNALFVYVRLYIIKLLETRSV